MFSIIIEINLSSLDSKKGVEDLKISSGKFNNLELDFSSGCIRDNGTLCGEHSNDFVNGVTLASIKNVSYNLI